MPPSFLTSIAMQDMPIMMVSIFHYCLKVFQYCNHALIKCGFCGLVHWPVAAVITGLSLLRPMYYEYPESSEAYTFDHQVRFPPQVVVKHRKQRNIAIFLYMLFHTHTVLLWCWHSGCSCDSTSGQHYSNSGKGDLDTRGSMTMKRIAYMCLSILLCPLFSIPM